MFNLEHHGIKGQKWGIRRYQNVDGSLTIEGKKRYLASSAYKNAINNQNDVQSIVNTMSKQERELLGNEPSAEKIAKQFIKRIDNIPIAFLNIYYGEDENASIAVGVRNDVKYRNKGYAVELVKKAQSWLDKKSTKEILKINVFDWYAKKENTASISLAKKYGFIEREDQNKYSKWWRGQYSHK